MKNVNLSKATSVVAKIVEIVHWVGTMVLLAVLILTIVGPIKDDVDKFMIHGEYTGESESGIEASVFVEKVVNIYDFQLNVLEENGRFSINAMRIVFIAGIVELAIWAMVFRNAHLIAKNTMNPQLSYFCPDNIRMLREIGIFAIASPVVSLIISVIARIVLGGNAEIAVSMSGLVIGLLVLFLTQFFIRGAELETEVEGLV